MFCLAVILQHRKSHIMLNKTTRINFFLSKPKGDTALVLNVIKNKIRVKRNIPDIKINALYWDKKKKRLKPNNPNKEELSDINNKLQNLEVLVSNRIDNYEFKIIDKAQLAKLIEDCLYKPERPLISATEDFSFFDYYERYLRNAKNEVSSGFLKAQRSVMYKLKKFEEYIGVRLTFECWEVNMFDEFYAYMLGLERYDKNGEQLFYNNSSINAITKKIKIFLSFAKNRKWHNSVEYREYKRKRQAAEDEAPIIALSWDEFLEWYHYEEENPMLDKVKDIFSFSCVTGLRYSDYSTLSKKEFKLVEVEDSKGNRMKLMETFIIKNRRRVAIRFPFSQYALEIVNKYMYDPSPYLLPHLYDSIITKGIKKIAFKLGFNELITSVYYSGGDQIRQTKYKWEVLSTHSGRKTFISKNVEEGVPLHIVASFTGHSKNSKALSRYYEISDKMKLDYIPMSLYKKA